MSIKVLQLHKRSSYKFKHIQDKFAISSDRKIFAVADGTTQSFNSEIWAEMIAKSFVSNPLFNVNELISLFIKSANQFKNTPFDYSSNPAKASLEKAKQNQGSTSTFAGLKFLGNNKIEIIFCGDSNLFLINSDKEVITFPYSDLDSLDANNSFINTEKLLQSKVDETFFKIQTLEYKLTDTIVLATDALSRLILKKHTVLEELIRIDNFDEFNEFCLKYWNNKELMEDDITALIIPINSMTEVKFIQPPDDFSFPMEKEKEFIPSTSFTENNLTVSEMNLNEIKNHNNLMVQELSILKKKLGLHELLLMITISLLLLILFFLYYVNHNNVRNDIFKLNPKSEVAVLENYRKTIVDLRAEIQTLKSSKKPENSKTENIEFSKSSKSVTEEEARKRQKKLIKAGYKVKVDGVWGVESEKYWKEYQK